MHQVRTLPAFDPVHHTHSGVRVDLREDVLQMLAQRQLFGVFRLQ